MLCENGKFVSFDSESAWRMNVWNEITNWNLLLARLVTRVWRRWRMSVSSPTTPRSALTRGSASSPDQTWAESQLTSGVPLKQRHMDCLKYIGYLLQIRCPQRFNGAGWQLCGLLSCPNISGRQNSRPDRGW